MTQLELANSLKAAYASSSTAELNTLLARKIPELWDEFGPYRVEKGCMAMIDAERFFSIAALREYIVAVPPIVAKRLERNTECSLCRDTKYVDAGDGRMVRCECPPHARIRYEGFKTEPIDVTAEIRKSRAAVDTETPPAEPDQSLGFFLIRCADGNWELRDPRLVNGFRRASMYEVILWRCMRFWKLQHFRDTRADVVHQGGHDQPVAAAPQVMAGDCR